MNKNCNEDLILHTYKELNSNNDGSKPITSKAMIADVINNGQFKFIKNTIEKGMFEDVSLKYFGKFKARHHLVQRFYNKLKFKQIK
jgi:hypothetical protein